MEWNFEKERDVEIAEHRKASEECIRDGGFGS